MNEDYYKTRCNEITDLKKKIEKGFITIDNQS